MLKWTKAIVFGREVTKEQREKAMREIKSVEEALKDIDKEVSKRIIADLIYMDTMNTAKGMRYYARMRM